MCAVCTFIVEMQLPQRVWCRCDFRLLYTRAFIVFSARHKSLNLGFWSLACTGCHTGCLCVNWTIGNLQQSTMEAENQLNMSLDDIINKHRKDRPVGNKKQQVMLTPFSEEWCLIVHRAAAPFHRRLSWQSFSATIVLQCQILWHPHKQSSVSFTGQARAEDQAITKGFQGPQKPCTGR